MVAYGTAKKPRAPTPYTSAGTAMNVYAVYRSPPSKNHETSVPKLRPPSAHSSSESSFDPPHREARNPMTVTARTSSTRMIVPLDIVGVSRGDHDDAQQQRRNQYPRKLVPIVEGQPKELRIDSVVELRQQRPDEREEQQRIPGALSHCGGLS